MGAEREVRVIRKVIRFFSKSCPWGLWKDVAAAIGGLWRIAVREAR